jgi:tRNA-specific 2-thiouridylase
VTKRSRVLVAMSGGVDSSLAAALLVEQGLEVVGVTLHLWDARGESQVGRCCAPEDRDDARRSCEHLGIPHYVLDERDSFRRDVVEPYIDANLAGITPSPCVGCNQKVKLGRLWGLLDELDAESLATGHYCRIGQGPNGEPELWRGRDRGKDQSYFLHGLDPALLDRLRFPLGELEKDQSREEARRLGLPNWNKPDSQELCFVPDGDTQGFIRRERGQSAGAGAIVDTAGRQLGRHEGIERFTVGQRKGLGIAADRPLYVLRVIPERAQVVVGDAAELDTPDAYVPLARWLCSAAPREPFQAQVRIRYRHEPAAARVTPEQAGFRVRFDEPQRAVAPGQAAVVYQGERVLGGGFLAAD